MQTRFIQFTSFLALLFCSASVHAKPNVVLIMIDDLGWKDVGCYGNDFVDTPNIDKLAEDGIRFTDFYAGSAVCSPSRASLMSGQTPARAGITAHIPGHWRPFERVIEPQTKMALPHDIVTIAESLKANGYHTGYIGKWHLGGKVFRPNTQGFNFEAVTEGPHLPGKFFVKWQKELKPDPNMFRAQFEAELAVQFIRRQKKKTFFLMVSPFAVHIPLGAEPQKYEKYVQRGKERGRALPHPAYAAMIEQCDDLVGRIVQTIEVAGLTDNTMIIFTSDNGGLHRRFNYVEALDYTISDLSPLRAEKGTLYEGGIRVPLVIKYPPLIAPNATTNAMAINYDFYPTLLDLTSSKAPENQTLDGLSLMPVLKDANAKLGRGAIYWHYPHYHHDRPASCIRTPQYKLIEYLDHSGDVELYDLTADIGETNNLAGERPKLTNKLKQQLNQWRMSLPASETLSNPNYDPKRAGEWWNRMDGKPIVRKETKRYSVIP